MGLAVRNYVGSTRHVLTEWFLFCCGNVFCESLKCLKFLFDVAVHVVIMHSCLLGYVSIAMVLLVFVFPVLISNIYISVTCSTQSSHSLQYLIGTVWLTL